MSSLYRRATPAQARILRVVEGAVKNAQDAHPEIKVSPQHRRSIAKRAAGTLAALWPALAANKPSEEGAEADTVTAAAPQSSNRLRAAVRGASTRTRRSPLGLLRSKLSRDMRRIRAEESADYVRAMIDVLRLIDAVKGRGS